MCSNLVFFFMTSSKTSLIGQKGNYISNYYNTNSVQRICMCVKKAFFKFFVKNLHWLSPQILYFSHEIYVFQKNYPLSQSLFSMQISCAFVYSRERYEVTINQNVKRGVTSFVKDCVYIYLLLASNKQFKYEMVQDRQYIIENSYLFLNEGLLFLTSTMHHLCKPEDLSDCGVNIFFAPTEGSSWYFC